MRVQPSCCSSMCCLSEGQVWVFPVRAQKCWCCQALTALSFSPLPSQVRDGAGAAPERGGRHQRAAPGAGPADAVQV